MEEASHLPVAVRDAPQMSPLFRLALAAAAGYLAHRKAASYETETTIESADGRTTQKVQRFNARGRFFIGLGVALFAWWAIPEVTGSGSRSASRLSGTARRLLAARPEPDEDEDCGCDA